MDKTLFNFETFGWLQDGAFLNHFSVWSVAAGPAVSLLLCCVRSSDDAAVLDGCMGALSLTHYGTHMVEESGIETNIASALRKQAQIC